MTEGRSAAGARWFWATLAGLGLFLAAMAALSPIVLDDWYQVAWHRAHALDPAAVLDHARYNYFNYNPRLGENLLLLVNGPWPYRVVLLPLVELGLLFTVVALVDGAWPRPTAEAARRLILFQALLWVTTPAPGLLYFYRPFTCNYLFGVLLHLLAVLPYRLALARPPRRWWAAALAPLAALAGLCNEHTGPATLAVLLVLGVVLWRRGRRAAFVPVGIVAFGLGYAALYFAPGQLQRYGGSGASLSRIESLLGHGLAGSYEILVRLFTHAQGGLLLAGLTLGAAALQARRRGVALTAPPAAALGLLGLLLWALAITATLLVSPFVGERLYFAPAVLLVAASGLALETLVRDPGLRRAVTVGATLVVVATAALMLRAQIVAHRDGARRVALLSSAARGSVVEVPAYSQTRRSRWFWGDDFAYASLREFVAHEVFDLDGIEVAGAPAWAEPSPPYHFEVDYEFEPPLGRAELARRVPLPTYTPSYWEWALAQQRRLLPRLVAVEGHVLRRVVVRVVGVPEPARSLVGARPLLADVWADGRWSFVYSRRRSDALGWPAFAFVPATLPRGLDEAWLVACGAAAPLTVSAERPLASFVPGSCDGLALAILCTPSECWLGGTYNGKTAPRAQTPGTQSTTPSTLRLPGRSR